LSSRRGEIISSQFGKRSRLITIAVVEVESIASLQQIALNIRLEAADHPPLYMLFLAIPSALGLGTTLAHMLWSAALGTAPECICGPG